MSWFCDDEDILTYWKLKTLNYEATFIEEAKKKIFLNHFIFCIDTSYPYLCVLEKRFFFHDFLFFIIHIINFANIFQIDFHGRKIIFIWYKYVWEYLLVERLIELLVDLEGGKLCLLNFLTPHLIHLQAIS